MLNVITEGRELIGSPEPVVIPKGRRLAGDGSDAHHAGGVFQV